MVNQSDDLGDITTAGQLKDALNANDEKAKKLLDSLKYYSQAIPGSSQFWYRKLQQVQAFHEHLRIRSEDTEMFNVFQTFSMADTHWEHLHR